MTLEEKTQKNINFLIFLSVLKPSELSNGSLFADDAY